MSILVEVWRDIPGVPFYQASTLGRIRSLDRDIVQRCKWGGTMGRHFCGKILTPHPNSHGYLQVSVGHGNPVTVHKLVSLAFLGERPAGTEVNHKDGDKLNCCPDNLEYGTSTENNHHALQTGLRKMKITGAQIIEMRKLRSTLSLAKIARRYGVHSSYVQYLIDGKRKVH